MKSISTYILLFFLSLCLQSCMKFSSSDSLIAIQIQDRNGLTETISSPEKLEPFQTTNFLSEQPYKKVLRFFKDNGKSSSVITTYHPNGKICQYLEVEELRAHGSFKEWFSNGQLRINATILNGTADVTYEAQKDWIFDGLSEAYDESGKLIAQVPYKQGSLEGTSLYYYPNGKIEKQIFFKNNIAEGEAVEYFPNSKLKSKTTYKLGNKHGLCKGYFENEQTAWEEFYKDNLLINGIYYNCKGDLISQVEDGRGMRALYDGNYLSYLVQMTQGYAEGAVQQFSHTEEFVSSYFIKGTKKHGLETIFFLSNERNDSTSKTPQPKITINWVEGKIHGSVKTWYPTGQLQSQRDYCNNKKMGPSISWYKDGSLMLVEEYEEDKITKGQYYKRNAIDSISSIVNGSGTAMLYDENGIFLRKISYAKGEPLDPAE